MVTKTLDLHIEEDPNITNGKPRIAGHRITVQDIVIWYEWMGRSADEIANEYGLTISDVYAALAYYHDHRVDIDLAIKKDETFLEALRQETPSKVSKKIHGD